MYKGHSDKVKFDIYSLCRDLIADEGLSVGLLVDFGSRHGESLEQLKGSCQPGTDFVFVEPAPRCVSILRELISKGEQGFGLHLIDAIVCNTDGTLPMFTFERDADQSANVFTDRAGRYGTADVVDVRTVGYGVFEKMFPGRDIDFAKVNIEGAEYAMIGDGFFQKHVKAFVMELHNEHVPGKSWRDALAGLENDYDITTYGNMGYRYCFMSGVRCC